MGCLVEELTGLREFEAFGFRCFLLELALAWLCLGYFDVWELRSKAN